MPRSKLRSRLACSRVDLLGVLAKLPAKLISIHESRKGSTGQLKSQAGPPYRGTLVFVHGGAERFHRFIMGLTPVGTGEEAQFRPTSAYRQPVQARLSTIRVLFAVMGSAHGNCPDHLVSHFDGQAALGVRRIRQQGRRRCSCREKGGGPEGLPQCITVLVFCWPISRLAIPAPSSRQKRLQQIAAVNHRDGNL